MLDVEIGGPPRKHEDDEHCCRGHGRDRRFRAPGDRHRRHRQRREGRERERIVSAEQHQEGGSDEIRAERR
ncbi:MAG: hypothetical protein ACXU87_20665, partial [Xanthobacteraceae bacterium]